MPVKGEITKCELSSLREMILSQGTIACFRAFLEASGPTVTINAIKPFSKHCGMALACNARKSLGFTGNGLEEVAMPFYWMGYGLANRDASLDVFEKGAVVRFSDCLLKNGPPEICVAFSHFIVDGISESINPRYEYIYTHHLTTDTRCQCVVREKGSHGDPYELGRFIKKVPDIALPEEEITFLRNNVIGESWSIVTNAFVNVHGSERMLELVKSDMCEIGRSIGLCIQEMMDTGVDEPVNLQYAIDCIYKALGNHPLNPNQVGRKGSGIVLDCPFKDSPIELCKQIEMIITGICKVIDPEIIFSYSSQKEIDKEGCEWVINRPGTLDTEKIEAKRKQNHSNKALKALTVKYATGEITKLEYDRMVRIIESEDDHEEHSE